MVPLSDSAPNGSHVNGFVPRDLWALQMPPLAPLPDSVPSWLEPQVDPAVAELQRLEHELGVARQRTAAAHHRLAAAEAAAQAALSAGAGAAHDALAQVEQRIAHSIELVREAARHEIDRIIAEARREAASRMGAVDPLSYPGAIDVG